MSVLPNKLTNTSAVGSPHTFCLAIDDSFGFKASGDLYISFSLLELEDCPDPLDVKVMGGFNIRLW